MLKLLAFVPEDGWAFVEKEERVLLVRPPYQQWAMTLAPEGVVERAVQQFGFTAQEMSFRDWGALISYLRAQYLERRREKGAEVPDSEEIRSLLHMASPEILGNYLDRVQAELLPQNEWKPALDLLTYLLGVESVKADSNLYNRTIQLLLQAKEAMLNEEEGRWRIVQPDASFLEMFPYAVQAYGIAAIRNHADLVARRGHTFSMG